VEKKSGHEKRLVRRLRWNASKAKDFLSLRITGWTFFRNRLL
jgi:hypothetical protein